MGQLYNKNVLLGVSGGIAAYKSADLVRRLQERGANVRVVMTRAATEFITPLTMQALSGNPVHMDLLDTEAEAAMGHIELARWADLLLIAPATADTIARLNSGRADDLLTAVFLATNAPVMIAPAMNQAMWSDPATQANLVSLAERGIISVGPAQGSQACGDVGPGRMEEPDTIAERAAAIFDSGKLDGLRVVVTAGPTREALDPVRYISNHSSGRMGYAIARAATEAGASVTLISGPVQLETPEHVTRVDVVSAADMLQAVDSALTNCDLFVGTAAVADYRPSSAATDKIKKDSEDMQIALVRNPDIISGVAARSPKPYTVGFAAETRDVKQYAQDKMARKRLDMIVANDVSAPGIGFNNEDNAATVFWSTGSADIERTSKSNMARQLIELIAAQMQKK